MQLKSYQTPIIYPHDDLLAIIAAAVPEIPERSVLCITSKVVALSEGAVVPQHQGTKEEKHALVAQEAERYIDPSQSKYSLMLTIKHGVLAVNAGIDVSNADSNYVLLPKNPFDSAARIWEWLRATYKVREVGVLITDSRTIPLKWGTMGTSLGFAGFAGLVNRIGEKDLFGYEMEMTQVSITEGLAAAAVLMMGEVAESTPLCLATEIPQVTFMDHTLTPEEIETLYIDPADDVYAPILQSASWKQR